MLGLYFQIRLAELRLYPNSSGAFQRHYTVSGIYSHHIIIHQSFLSAASNAVTEPCSTTQSPALMKISLTKQLLQGILWVYLCGRTIRLNLCYVLLVFPHLLCRKCLVSSWLAAFLSQRFKD